MELTLGIRSSRILRQSHLLISLENILSHVRPEKKSIFGIHDHSGLRNLFQLSVGLSSFRYHKRCHNFIDTPSDKWSCNYRPEDINRFFRVHTMPLVEQP